MSILDTLIFGVRSIFFAGSEVVSRNELEIVGADVAVTDDPVNKRTILTFTGQGPQGDQGDPGPPGSNVWPTDLTDTRIVRGVWISDAAANYNLGAFAAESAILGKIAAMVIDGTDLPHGSVLTGVSVGLQGKSGHSAFPGGKPTMPLMDLVAWDSTAPGADPASVIGGPVVDASATAGAFEAVHTLSATGLSVTIDATRYVYAVLFVAEDNPNGRVGDVVFGPKVTFKRPAGGAVGRN